MTTCGRCNAPLPVGHPHRFIHVFEPDNFGGSTRKTPVCSPCAASLDDTRRLREAFRRRSSR